MDSLQRHPITDEEARRAAKSLVRYFRAPLKVFGNRGLEEPPLTIADTIRLGGTLLSGLNIATGRDWLKEKNREFLTNIAELIYQPEAMEEFLYIRIKERAENPDDINKAITQIEEQLSGPGAALRFIKKIIKEVLPKMRQGRPTEFDPVIDPDRFLALSTEMTADCERFLGLREKFPEKSHKELIEFLQCKAPDGTNLMRKHQSYISEVMNELEFRTLKTEKARVRRLADAIAGKELRGWAFSYSVQQAGVFRRAKGIKPEE